MLSAKLRISNITVWTIHFVGISLNSRQTRSKVWFPFLFFFCLCINLNISSKASFYLFIVLNCCLFWDAICMINTKFFGFRKDFDDVFLESCSFGLFKGDTIINSKTIDWKIVFRNIWVFEIKIFDRIWFVWILRKEEVSSKSVTFFYFLLIIFYKF